MSNKTNNLKAYLRDLYEGIVSKKPDASRNPQNFRSEIEAIRTGGELYEVMDASELPNDAPDGSLALVEGEPIPEAYTVSSIDELPSNAVDGSMAIVEGMREAMANTTWLLNEYIQSEDSNELKALPIEFNYVNWKGEENFASIILVYNLEGYSFLTYSGIIATNDGVYDDGWGEENPEYYRTITILKEPSTESAEWIRANGTKQSGDTVYTPTYSLYTRENGEWVYKCEVV